MRWRIWHGIFNLCNYCSHLYIYLMDSKIHKKPFFFYQLPLFSRVFYIGIACLSLAFIVSSCKKDDPAATPTGRTTTKSLISSPGSTMGGSVTIAENKDQSYNIEIDLTNTPKDSTIYIDVHNGSFVDPFEKQANDFGTIVGTGGNVSKTILNVSKATLPDLTRVTVPYDSILTYKGFINIAFVSKPHNTSTTVAHVMLDQ
jgi:hypothetical protein